MRTLLIVKDTAQGNAETGSRRGLFTLPLFRLRLLGRLFKSAARPTPMGGAYISDSEACWRTVRSPACTACHVYTKCTVTGLRHRTECAVRSPPSRSLWCLPTTLGYGREL
ncbi:hypothetical protein RR46_09498 [Papilio xuthus]|uniref:Uncharacterized protein n=1 Tax=Papilio xuthus TaxID=66420 RepID=A0A194PY72_PAPXU|nr:hypothetical protein RR46_09498 [Papilio xuthus]